MNSWRLGANWSALITMYHIIKEKENKGGGEEKEEKSSNISD